MTAGIGTYRGTEGIDTKEELGQTNNKTVSKKEKKEDDDNDDDEDDGEEDDEESDVDYESLIPTVTHKGSHPTRFTNHQLLLLYTRTTKCTQSLPKIVTISTRKLEHPNPFSMSFTVMFLWSIVKTARKSMSGIIALIFTVRIATRKNGLGITCQH